MRHTEAVLANLAEAEAELEAIAGIRGGRVRLASFQTAGSAIVPQAIATFRARHPGVELSLVEAEPVDAIPALRTGELDVALVVEPNGITEEPGTGSTALDLLDDPMYVALPLDHELTRKVRVKLKDLAGEQWINPPLAYPCSGFVTRACAAAGFEPHVTFETDDYLAVQGLVAAGVGIALIPDLALTTVRDDIVIRSLGSQAPVRHVVAITPERLPLARHRRDARGAAGDEPGVLGRAGGGRPGVVNRRSLVLLLTLAALWGASYLFIKIGLRGVLRRPRSPSIRIGLAALVLFPLALRPRRPARASAGARPRSLCWAAIHMAYRSR